MDSDSEFGGLGFSAKSTGPVRRNYWNRRWVPITANGCGDYIFVDMDPTSRGSRGQIVDWWHEGAEKMFLARNLREFLNDIVKDLKNGTYTFGRA